MGMADLLIRGNVVTPSGVLEDGWVTVKGEKIAAVGTGTEPPASQRLDAGTSYVMPGLIDGQTHAGSQFGFSGVEFATKAGIAGGITTIVDMPYDEPQPVDSVAVLNEKVAAIARHALADVALYGTVSKVPSVDNIRGLVDAGVAAFKISSFENHPTRFPRITNEHALTLLETVAHTKVPVGLHNEDQEIVKATIARLVEQGKTAPEHHDESRPISAELTATVNFLELGAASGAHVHIVHISTPRGFDIVRQYADSGVRATAEMCIHYLHFDAAEDIQRLGALMKVNPPIRSNVREALWQELKNGNVAFVSSDHSAWPLARKQSPSIYQVAAGIPGLETLAPAFFSGLKRRGEDAAVQTAYLMAEQPARFFGLWPRKGALVPGADADITIMDPTPWTYRAGQPHDTLGWSPFDGEQFDARATATFVRGRKVWDGQKVTVEPGHGRYVPRIDA